MCFAGKGHDKLMTYYDDCGWTYVLEDQLVGIQDLLRFTKNRKAINTFPLSI